MSATPVHLVDAISALCSTVNSTLKTVNQTELLVYRHCRAGRGTADALFFLGETYSYQQIADQASRCTNWLRSLGVKPGDRIVISLPDCPTFVAAYFGGLGVGATAIILDPALPPEDAFYMAQHCEARLAIVHDKVLNRLIGLRSLNGMIAIASAALSWTEPSEFTDAISSQEPSYSVQPNPSGHAYGLFTSGSTGRPKLIVHRHSDILYGYQALGRAVLALSANDRVLSVPKMTTGYGLNCSLLMPFLSGASSALVDEPPTLAALGNALVGFRCTILFAQPRFLAQALAECQSGEIFHTLRLVISAGEPLSSVLLDRWSQLSRCELLDSYGSTEIGNCYITNRPGESKRGSVGRAIAGIEIEIVDDAGNQVPRGHIGKLRVRGPMVIEEYWNDAARSELNFRDGWFTTSDLFSVDDDGFYFIHGRADHLIKLGCGHWVNPSEIEAVLLEHPLVRENAIVGTPDENGLTSLKAFVVVDGPRKIDQRLAVEISSLIVERWPTEPYKHIAAMHFTNSLPKTAAGKLDRAKLNPQSMTEFSYKC